MSNIILLEAFQIPHIDWIKNHLHGKGKTSVGGLTCPEIHQIFDMVLNINRSIKPILFTHFRKKNMVSFEKNNDFIAGSYHMPMLVGKKIDTKGQIKPKADWRAIDSPKKGTDKFVFFLP